MAAINRTAQAGTVESSDILITLSPAAGTGIQIELTTPTPRQYGRQIRDLIRRTLAECGIDSATVHAADKGALDYTIKARLVTAVERACGKEEGQ